METDGTRGRNLPSTSPPSQNNESSYTSSNSSRPKMRSNPLASTPNSKPLTLRDISKDSPNRQCTENWFDIQFDISKEEQSKLISRAVNAKKHLKHLQSKEVSSKDAVDHKNECDEQTVIIFNSLILAGLFKQAHPYLNEARLNLTTNSTHETAGHIHYGLFLLHYMDGKYAETIENLNQCMGYGNLSASWELALIHLGLVDDYQTFCDPGRAWNTLQKLKKRLTQMRNRDETQTTIYENQPDIGEALKQRWDIFLPIMKNTSQLPSALDLLDKIRSYYPDITETQSNTSISPPINETTIFMFIEHLVESTIVIQLYDKNNSEPINTMNGYWRKYKNSLVSTAHCTMYKLPKNKQDPFSRSILDNRLLWSAFLNYPDSLQKHVLNLATAIYETKEQTDSSEKLTYSLNELYDESRTAPQTKRLLLAIAKSASEVSWSRDSIRFLVGIDLPKNVETALTYAQCLSLINPARGSVLTALCLRELNKKEQFVTTLTDITENHSSIPATLMLGDHYQKHRDIQKALTYYLQAGEAGSAAGYIKAAEILLPQANQQVALWGVASAYYQQAAQLLSSRRMDAEEQHCLAMAECCESIMDSQEKTTMTQPASATEPEPITTDATQAFSQPFTANHPVKTSSASSRAKKVKKPARPRRQSEKPNTTTPPSKPTDKFWPEMKRANQLVQCLDFAKAEDKLVLIAKDFPSAEFIPRIDQMKAWICKMKIDHRALADIKESNTCLANKGWKHIADGIRNLTGKIATPDNIIHLNFDVTQLSQEEKRSLASLLSTAAHLSNLKAAFTHSERLAQMCRDLYHEADTINPGRIKRKIEATSHKESGVQVVDTETFEMLKAAIK